MKKPVDDIKNSTGKTSANLLNFEEREFRIDRNLIISPYQTNRQMGKILLEGMEFFSYHGCFKEEQIIGTRFVVDLEMEFDTSPAEASDHLRDTVNYQEVYQVVKNEMEQKSHLLEHVARRILNSIKKSFPMVRSLTVRISKINPSLGGKVRQVSCLLTQ
jgi:dihydroneopterin aldolase